MTDAIRYAAFGLYLQERQGGMRRSVAACARSVLEDYESHRAAYEARASRGAR